MPKTLNDAQRAEIDHMYTTVMRKYFVYSTDNVGFGPVPVMTEQEARDLATYENGAKQAKILADYEERVEAINANAAARGMEQCSVVCNQIDKAITRKNDALARLENVIEKRTKQILTENQKLRLAVEKDRAATGSRSLRDAGTMVKVKAMYNYDPLALADDELFYLYMDWLMQYPLDTALIYLTDYSFIQNLSGSKYMQLDQELRGRRLVANV